MSRLCSRARRIRPGPAGGSLLGGLVLFLVAALSTSRPAPAQDRQMGSGTVGGYRLNEFGPSGGKCMDACGPSCPDTCEVLTFSRCHRERANFIVQGTRYTCGAHASCAEHDDCLETCKTQQGDDYQPVDFFIADCQRVCHLNAAGQADDIVGGSGRAPFRFFPSGHIIADGAAAATSAAIRYGPTAKAIGGWIRGGGPQSTTGVWEYTKDCPDCPEVLESCKQCEKCETEARPDGSTVARCVPNGEACPPCVSCGEVHISTLDRLRYDFQGAGEFVLFEDVTRSLVVQIRTEPSGEGTVTFNTAVAMLVAGDVVAVHVRPALRIVVNGETVGLTEDDHRDLPGGGSLGRDRKIVTVRWPDGSVVQARTAGSYMNIGAWVAGALAGRMRGLAGDRDGDPENDLRTRDGVELPRRLDHSVLYGRFGNGWRIGQEESLIWYADGETTATYQRPEIPTRRIRLEDLDPGALELAEAACREQGIEHPRLYRDCVFDVAVTGDTSLTTAHWLSQPPVAAVPASYLADGEPRSISLDAPAAITAGARFDVTWTGDPATGDFVAIAEPEAPPDAYLAYRLARSGAPARLTSPDRPGRYEIRYIQGETVAAARNLEVSSVAASLAFAARAQAGRALEVRFTGPAGALDYIAIAEPSALPGEYHQYRYTSRGSPATLDLPEKPGTYEVRYVQGQSKTVLASRPVAVLAVTASLTAAAQMPAGGQLEVGWTGPGNRLDYIAVADPSASPRTYHQYRYTSRGNPVTLDLPEEPGTYELRYLQGQSHTILATRPIEILPVEASLDAVARAPSGARIEVGWTGPGNRVDYVTVAAPEAPPREYHQHSFTNRGNPVSLDLPEVPGTYELRYIQGQSHTILASSGIEILPVTATLEADAKVAANAEIEVTWTGPGNRLDYIAIAAPAAEPKDHVVYQYTRRRSPLGLKAPAQPGTYEIRYVQGQSHTVLARRAVTVTP